MQRRLPYNCGAQLRAVIENYDLDGFCNNSDVSQKAKNNHIDAFFSFGKDDVKICTFSRSQQIKTAAFKTVTEIAAMQQSFSKN